jgi:hypothetical protein
MNTHLSVLDDQISLLLSFTGQVSLDDIVSTGCVSVLGVEGCTRDMGGHTITTAFSLALTYGVMKRNRLTKGVDHLSPSVIFGRRLDICTSVSVWVERNEQDSPQTSPA